MEVTFATSADLGPPDARRVTGPGPFWAGPGAVLDVVLCRLDLAGVIERHARQVQQALGGALFGANVTVRHFSGGLSFHVPARLDLASWAVGVAEVIWHFCAAEVVGEPPRDFEALIAELRADAVAEANPALVGLADAAQARGLDFLWDDDAVSIGHGTGSHSWDAGALPRADAVDWDALHNIPVALITGTNGKTTTTRLCAAIGRAAGLQSGLTSTDSVRVGDRVLDEGDYSGPGGARLLLRDRALQIGFLEVARGGILRRGLPLTHARAAAVLNAAADHLGEYGVNTVEDLAVVKLSVERALAPGGILVLNADDPAVVRQAAATSATIWWFSQHPDAPQIRAAKAGGLACAWQHGGELVFFDGTDAQDVISVNNVPLALQGRAGYNVLNALAAICLTRALGLDVTAIRSGLAGFRNDVTDNPGRCNEFAVKGARVFVDFAHNPHSIAAVTGALGNISAKRRLVMISNAGDRSDEDIRGLVRGAFALRPDVVVAAELEGYLRGRRLGEIPALIRQTCLDLGLAADNILSASSPLRGAELIVDLLQPDDLALLLVHSERYEIFRMLSGG